MRPCPNPLIERYRVTTGPFASTWEECGNTGYFLIPYDGERLKCVVSDKCGWDHVSVTVEGRKKPPNWRQMCFIKDQFFDPEEVVMQLHPAASDYVNNHPGCLHLWRPHDDSIPLPPSIMVGVKELGVLA